MRFSSLSLLRLAAVGLVGAFLFSNGTGPVGATIGDTTTFLGRPYSGDGGPAINAYLDMPGGFTVDGDGNIFIADKFNNAIRKMDTSGNMSTVSGDGEFGLKDGHVNQAEWGWPEGITRTSDGTLYVADTVNSVIRRISGDQVSTLSLDKKLNRPIDVDIVGSTVYVLENAANRLVKTTTSGGTVTTIADVANPQKMVIKDGYAYVTEWETGNVIKVDLNSGSKTTFGSGFTEPRAVAIYGDKLFVTAGENGVWNEIWTINLTTGEKTRLIQRRETESLNNAADMFIREVTGTAGTPKIYQLFQGGSAIFTFDIDSSNEKQIAGKKRYADEMGSRSLALLGHPVGLEATADGTKLFISYEQGNKFAVYDFTTDTVSEIAGFPMDNYKEPGTGTEARFSDASSMAVAPDGYTLYLVDRNNNRIRTLNTKTKTTGYFTGAGEINSTPKTNNGYQEGGPCLDQFEKGVSGCAYFNRPTGLAMNKAGSVIYVADAGNNRVRKVEVSTGKTSLIAGSGAEGFKNGTGSEAQFDGPFSLTLSTDEKYLYVADKGNHAIRAIELSSNKVTTLVGKGKIGYKEGKFKDAVLAIPEYIELGPDGNLYVSEAGSLRVRKLDLKKQETSLVSGGNRGKKDGSGEKAEWNAPKGLTFANQTLFVADFYNDLIRAIDMKGELPGPAYTPIPSKGFMGYSPKLRGGYFVAAGNVFDDAREEIITGTGKGLGPHVQVYDQEGNVKASFFAYAKHLRSGIRAASGDVDGNGRDEIITCAGPTGRPHVRIFHGNGTPFNAGFFALDGKFKGGIYCAAGDVNGDGKDDIIVGAGEGASQVTVHNADGKLMASFFPYGNTFKGGVTVAATDTDGDGLDEIITGPELGAPSILVFKVNGSTAQKINKGFYAFDSKLRNGVSVAGGDFNGDGKGDIIVGAGPKEEPLVRVFNPDGWIMKEFRPYAKNVRGGSMVAAGNTDTDSKDEIIIVPRTAGGPHIQVVDY